MKKILALLSIVLLVTVQVNAAPKEEIFATLGSIEVKTIDYSKQWERERMTIKILIDPKNDKKNVFHFSFGRGRYELNLDNAKLNATFIEALHKYLEWEQLAIEKEVKASEEIKKIKLQGTWESNNSRYRIWPSSMMSMRLFSQSPKEHDLALQFSEAMATVSRYTIFKPETLYISGDQVKALIKILEDEENIAKQVQEARDQAARKTDLFK
ncbi:hypothetical protein PVA45_04240 [Entomospira entomophila]|uniref:DUF4412 domain-containing protein n=1 Tax=Entomospira entomophila TaxID=2719988 RepID=A0A968GBS3_9SPIO|nr:hypothetical protein [Entomospira entomophilus]NIZ40718.1 hypothetical protein [Entomospira entomophilus]WDI34931.1 hypothetical protein PVA45_04240 [Entomospira entomophilus]